jgi:hypothetical protein
LPDGTLIKPAKLRGEASEGMLFQRLNSAWLTKPTDCWN